MNTENAMERDGLEAANAGGDGAGGDGSMTPTPRVGRFSRTTRETSIQVAVGLDGRLDDDAVVCERRIDVPNGFFGHMLDALATHAGWAVELTATGDTQVDLHHTVEDVGIALGEAVRAALAERRGVVRFAYAYAPLDEALARVVVDLSGRGYYVASWPPELTGAWVTRELPLTLFDDFFQAFADRGRFTLHLDVLRARNPHHAAEAAFKALALALRSAVAYRSRNHQTLEGAAAAVPSTKGSLA